MKCKRRKLLSGSHSNWTAKSSGYIWQKKSKHPYTWNVLKFKTVLDVKVEKKFENSTRKLATKVIGTVGLYFIYLFIYIETKHRRTRGPRLWVMLMSLKKFWNIPKINFCFKFCLGNYHCFTYWLTFPHSKLLLFIVVVVWRRRNRW